MQLTESEKAHIETARKISARWPRTKWVALLIAILILVCIVIYLYDGSQFAGCILCGFAGYVSIRNLIVTIKWWKGMVPFELLLKLLTELENPTR